MLRSFAQGPCASDFRASLRSVHVGRCRAFRRANGHMHLAYLPARATLPRIDFVP